jgi:hypothetical protein
MRQKVCLICWFCENCPELLTYMTRPEPVCPAPPVSIDSPGFARILEWDEPDWEVYWALFRGKPVQRLCSVHILATLPGRSSLFLADSWRRVVKAPDSAARWRHSASSIGHCANAFTKCVGRSWRLGG